VLPRYLTGDGPVVLVVWPLKRCWGAEILRVLKPGQLFAGYEWCLTDKYDPSNPQHSQIKKVIEIDQFAQRGMLNAQAPVST